MTRPSPRVLSLCALLVVSPALFTSSIATTKFDNSCELLREWARPYANRSPTLDDLAQFDRPHRIAIFNAVTPTVRAALWRDQLQRFSRGPDLSEEQRVFLQEAAVAITPARYELAAMTRGDNARKLWARAAPLFATPEHRRPWFDLGSVVKAPEQPAAAVLDRLTAPFRAVAQLPWCECSGPWGEWECAPGVCLSAPCRGIGGCGPQGGFLCEGMCVY